MADENDDVIFDPEYGKAWRKLRETFAERRAREERAMKPHYFPKWLEEAGVMAFLDFLLADEGTTPEARQRAKDLRSRLKARPCIV